MNASPGDLVYLQFGLDDDADGELIKRSQLPDDAYESAGSVTAEPVGGEPGVFYPLWILETDDLE
ncbi:hypothetical protein P2P98_14005 [Microbacterium sp. Kw_RZR3]|uniref:hypothetical protein n=1 Tax=Microbacterium sp. Kw_RZR3 TaxID=3032903 RepID=UPI0023DB7FE3|nr:hypothetical protein [Microbacterium sp. Kw_RZR3]MDF2047276.1 hypothetical protein [Microbacterium sp. Kw_RZR3]